MTTKFNHDLFTQLGGANWVARKGFFDEKPAMDHEQPQSIIVDEKPITPLVDESSSQVDQAVSAPLDEAKAPAVQIENAVVLIGPGLDAIWQNEEEQAWRLWQNIMLAFDWDESQVVFYDLDHLVSEEAAFSTIEEVIDLGVDWVLSMEAGHPVADQLSDGVQVVDIPDFDSMLVDPYAKQSFYQAVVQLV